MTWKHRLSDAEKAARLAEKVAKSLGSEAAHAAKVEQSLAFWQQWLDAGGTDFWPSYFSDPVLLPEFARAQGLRLHIARTRLFRAARWRHQLPDYPELSIIEALRKRRKDEKEARGSLA